MAQRFPEHERRIRELMELDPEFRELCQDYAGVVDAIAVGATTREDDTDAIQLELLRLRSDLEGDILAKLS